MRILIGVCKTRDYFPFDLSLKSFMAKSKHDLDLITIKNKFLPDAQNDICKIFMDGDYESLLLLDDDHWGHTEEMLDCLIGADSLISTIKSYSRHYPYSCCLMKRIDGSYAGIENGQGYQECDMTGFPMTLLRKELFEKLEKPYFVPKVEGLRDWTTDEPFCKRILELGIKPVGCFQYTLSHDNVTQENVWQKREAERMDNNNKALYMLFKKRLQKE